MKFRPEGNIIFFATNNINKFNETRSVLAEHKITVGMLRVKGMEIQSDSLQDIAQTSALYAFRKCGLPIIVEDAGLFVNSLKGFPGPYAAYVYRTIGNEGLLQIMKKAKNRKARFESVVACCSKTSESPICFRGETIGEITMEERRGKNEVGFGFDPIFKPKRSEKTFAEMTLAEKNELSHRAMALQQFAEWYKKRP